MQNEASIVFDNRQARMRRGNQSITATRQTTPHTIGR